MFFPNKQIRISFEKQRNERIPITHTLLLSTWRQYYNFSNVEIRWYWMMLVTNERQDEPISLLETEASTCKEKM